MSDELKARMAETGDALNWSDIARPAFETAIAAFNHRKGQNMSTAIERLRASKAAYQGARDQDGKSAGRDWATHHAEFGDLKRLGDIDVSLYFDDPDTIWRAIKAAVDPDDTEEDRDLAERLFDDRHPPEGGYLVAWVEGAQEFFAEVENQL
ncbi:hypothetical protein [Methylobacterium sp. J-070]|uniref:hypothetical protein n=1 Tax=Methylobacterium sp. J-070 TaxID=2836650 RepID=UPI001FBA3A43|nr:hypothetical protein [Methylobacterium sp. J-070]MCJ2054760.1 hypothetical protein [Methylobacterium sp. J-070]